MQRKFLRITQHDIKLYFDWPRIDGTFGGYF